MDVIILVIYIIGIACIIIQGRRRHWAVYCTSPQSLLISFLIRWFNNFGNFSTFQPLIVIYRSNNFVYHHWGCVSIYQPLSYPFRSLMKYLPGTSRKSQVLLQDNFVSVGIRLCAGKHFI